MKKVEITILCVSFFFVNINCTGKTERKTMEPMLDSILNVVSIDIIKKMDLEKNSFILSSQDVNILFARDTNKILVDELFMNTTYLQQRHYFLDNYIYILNPIKSTVLDSIHYLDINKTILEETHKPIDFNETKFFTNNSSKVQVAFSNTTFGVVIGECIKNKIINIKHYYYGFDGDYKDSVLNQKLNLKDIFYCQKDNSNSYGAPRILYQDTLYAGVKSAQIYDGDTFLYSINGNNLTFKNKVKLNTDSVQILLPFPLNNKIYFYYFLSNNKTIIYGYDIKKCSAKKYVLDFAMQVNDDIYFTNSGFLTSFETLETDDYYDSYKYGFIKY